LILILIYFEWCDTENQQLAGILKTACSVLPSMLNAALPVGAVLTTFTSSGFSPSDTI